MSEIESINELHSDLFSPEEVDRFSDPKEARKKAMDYLARREYGQQELEQKLIAAGFEAAIATETVDKLAGEGLQDDRRFIDNFVQSRINQGKGPVRIRQELGERDLDAGLKLTGPLPGRNRDILSVGVDFIKFGSDYLSAQRSQGNDVSKHQLTVEFTYRVQVTGWLTVQPDLQVFFDPHFSLRDAIVFGLQTVIDL